MAGHKTRTFQQMSVVGDVFAGSIIVLTVFSVLLSARGFVCYKLVDSLCKD